MPDEPEGREWLIALEQYAADDGSAGVGAEDARAEAVESASGWRLRHKRTAEKQARKARVNEAAEQADNS